MKTIMHAALTILAAFAIFTMGLLAGIAGVEHRRDAEPHRNGYLSNFSDDSASCYQQGQWIVCVPKKPAGSEWGGDACFDGAGNVVPCKEERQ